MEETVCAIALASVAGIGPRRFSALVSRFGSATSAFHATIPELTDFFGSGARELARRIVDARKERSVTLRIERLLQKAGARGIRALPYTSVAYPKALKFIADPPPVLWVSGDLSDDSVRVSIVGTRRSTQYGNRVAREMAQALCTSGVHVVSGLAYGIDSHAHEACVRLKKPTIAVSGCPVDALLDYERGSLPLRILEAGGALVSEYAPGSSTVRANFVARNRIVSGLSRAVVVVEAPEKSGALITAAFALDQGRDVMAVPGSVYAIQSTGCHNLIRDGAALVRCAADVMSQLGLDQKSETTDVMYSPFVQQMNDYQARVYSALQYGPVRFNAIVEMTKLDAVTVGSALGMLEVRGLIRQAGSGMFSRLTDV